MNLFSHKNLAFLLFILFAFITVSCGKKWKKPSETYFKFQLNSNSSNGPVKFTSGYLMLNKFQFIGDRKQGQKHIEQEQSFSNNQQEDLYENGTGAEVKFDIPQGTYTHIELQLETNGDQTGTSLELKGNYIDATDDTIPVLFDFAANDALKITATSTNGGSEIILQDDKTTHASVIMNPNYWFASVPQSMLDSASQNVVDGNSTIVIDKNNNIDIYNLIVNRIQEGNKAVFD